MTERSTTVRSRRTAAKTIKVKVLVVDPNPSTRVLLKDSLRTLDLVEAVGEKSSFNGLADILRSSPMDVVLLDQGSGDPDVFSVISDLKKDASSADSKFIVLVEELNESVKVKGEQVGVNAFVTKPYDMKRVEMALMDAIRPPDKSVAKEIPEALRQILNKFRQVSLFFGFSDMELIRMLKICKSRKIAAGDYLFKEGDMGDSLFVVVSGQIDITKNQNGSSNVLVSMEAGDCFGEMAIIDSEPRMADAVAASEVTVLEINQSIINDNEDITSLKLVRQIAIVLARKLRASSQK